MHSLTSILSDGVILDVDGTIWNTTGIVASAWNKAIDGLHLDANRVNDAILRLEFGKTMRTIADDLWPRLDEGQKTSLMAECCRQEQAALRQLNTAGYMSAADICYSGVVEAVQRMSRRVPFFIVSNCQAGYIELVMDKTGLEPCIRDYECYGRTGYGKADNIRLLAKRNELSHPVYVGDTQGDAAACAEAGVDFVWASYGFGRDVAAKWRIDKFEEIEDVIHF